MGAIPLRMQAKTAYSTAIAATRNLGSLFLQRYRTNSAISSTPAITFDSGERVVVRTAPVNHRNRNVQQA